jgi:hypothetical protein
MPAWLDLDARVSDRGVQFWVGREKRRFHLYDSGFRPLF